MSGIWPGDTQCVVMLGFDIDGVSSAINRDPSSANLPSLMSMREYGPSVGTPRILDLLDRHGIPASFYIPGYVAETHEDLVREIHHRGHEVAHHGYMHEPPATLSRSQEADALDRGIEILRGLTGETASRIPFAKLGAQRALPRAPGRQGLRLRFEPHGRRRSVHNQRGRPHPG